MIEMIVQLVEQYGYMIFYLAFGLGPFGIPVPNEIMILTGGLIVDNGMLNPWIIYGCIVAGLLTAINIGFLLGKYFGGWITLFFKKKRSIHHFKKAEKLFQAYGHIAICLSISIPFVRYVVPIIAGMSGVKYKKFVLLSTASVLMWTAIFFTAGLTFGEPIMRLLANVDLKWIGAGLLGAAALIVVIHGIKIKLIKRFVVQEKSSL